jgi:HSP20 family protein
MTLFRFSDPLDPVSGLLSLQRELERALEASPGWDVGLSGRGVFPAMNIFNAPEGCVVRLEVPGVAPSDINVEAHGRTLTVHGKREGRVPDGASFHRRERGSGEFSRSIRLPEDADPARAEASYQHGILTLRVPKKEEAKPKQISVKAS